jgi:hypothetical protein
MTGVLGALLGSGSSGGGGGGGVTIDTVNAHGISGNLISSAIFNNQVVTTGNALLLVVINVGGGAMSAVSADWDHNGTPQSMTSIGSVSGGGTSQVFMFGLLNPHSGTLSSQINWTGSSQIIVEYMSFNGVNSTFANAFKNFASATNAAPISTSVTSATGNIVVGGFASATNFTSTNQTQDFIDNTATTNAAAANHASGAASVTLTGNPGNVAAAAVAGVSVSQ